MILSYIPAAPLKVASSASQLAWMSLRMRKRTDLGGNQTQQRNLRRRADADRKSNRADSPAYIDGRRGAGWPALAIVSIHEGSDEAGDIQRLVENLDVDLAAMRVPGD